MVVHIRRPGPVIMARVAAEQEVLAAAVLVRDAVALRGRLECEATRGLYVGAVERLEAAAVRMGGEDDGARIS
jgi:hypothetical protein